jgi:hypothetical protein
MRWNVYISPYDSSRSRAVSLETGLEVISKDPEHDICHKLRLEGCAEGPVDFWRNDKIAMTFRSLTWGAGYRIRTQTLRLEKRRKAPLLPSIAKHTVGALRGVTIHGRNGPRRCPT